MSIMICRAEAQDAVELAKMAMKVHEMHLTWQPSIFRMATLEEVEALFRKWINEEPFVAYLALQGNKALGYVALRAVERSGHALMHPRRFVDVEQMYVIPSERRTGICRAFMEKAKQFARSREMSRVELNVWSENTDAIAAYAACDFEPMSQRMSFNLEE